MGAGALEAPTSKLRRYPVFDIGVLNKKECEQLIRLGEAVWEKGTPTDWAKASFTPDRHTQASGQMAAY